MNDVDCLSQPEGRHTSLSLGSNLSFWPHTLRLPRQGGFSSTNGCTEAGERSLGAAPHRDTFLPGDGVKVLRF